MLRELISPRRMEALDNFFPDFCTIRRKGSTATGVVERDSTGAPRKGGGRVVDAVQDGQAVVLEDRPCALAQLTEDEKLSLGVPATSTHDILFQARYEGIDSSMEAIVNGTAYNILAVSEGLNQFTRLTVSAISR